MKIIKRWLEKRRQKRKQGLRDNLAESLRFIRNEKNSGLLFERLIAMPGVYHVTAHSGGFRKAYVGVTMNDGFDISADGFCEKDAFRRAALQVAGRIKEVSPIGSEEVGE